MKVVIDGAFDMIIKILHFDSGISCLILLLSKIRVRFIFFLISTCGILVETQKNKFLDCRIF